MQILQVNASIRLGEAHSTGIADAIVTRLQARHPGTQITRRDLGRTPHPPLDADTLGALATPSHARNPEQAARIALDDTLISEVQAADVIVLGVPMYNFGVPVQLKNWLDAIARNGVTFRYTAEGPEGLLTGKTVYAGLARGGRYRDTSTDSQVPFLRTILGFLGMTDVHFIYAEGLNMGPDALAAGLAQAHTEIAAVLA